jgi:glycine/D-amino acid oxidase-like deaminating enzyme
LKPQLHNVVLIIMSRACRPVSWATLRLRFHSCVAFASSFGKIHVPYGANFPKVGPVLDSRPSQSMEGDLLRSNYKGQFIAAGYTGHGMPRAYGCAEVAVQMIADERAGRTWVTPAWFPRPFLTWVRDAR